MVENRPFVTFLSHLTVIVGLVTFFPTFVALTTAMRDAPAQACELITAYGGSALRELGWLVSWAR